MNVLASELAGSNVTIGILLKTKGPKQFVCGFQFNPSKASGEVQMKGNEWLLATILPEYSGVSSNKTKLAVDSHNSSACRKIFDTLPFCNYQFDLWFFICT